MATFGHHRTPIYERSPPNSRWGLFSFSSSFLSFFSSLHDFSFCCPQLPFVLFAPLLTKTTTSTTITITHQRPALFVFFSFVLTNFVHRRHHYLFVLSILFARRFHIVTASCIKPHTLPWDPPQSSTPSVSNHIRTVLSFPRTTSSYPFHVFFFCFLFFFFACFVSIIIPSHSTPSIPTICIDFLIIIAFCI